MIAGLLAAVSFAAASPPPATVRSPFAGCPRGNTRVIGKAPLDFPENARPTHERVLFLLDLGSDGRIRRSAMTESSGDAAIDAAAAKAVAEYRFAPPTMGCVAASSVWRAWWDMPPAALASALPAEADPASSPVPSSPAPSSPLPCAAPFVQPTRFPLPLRRIAPGSAAVDVALDANARVMAVHLAQSSGNKKSDYAATIAARNAVYIFRRQPGCAPTATTYRLELTFH